MTLAIDKSRLMKRAWYLVKERGYKIGYAMKTVWGEMKAYAVEKKNELAYLESLKMPQNSLSVPFNPSADTMQSYYNSSCYKGD